MAVTQKRFLTIFLVSLLPMIAVLCYLVVYSSTTSTYTTFSLIMAIALWIVFCIEVGGKLQKREGKLPEKS